MLNFQIKGVVLTWARWRSTSDPLKTASSSDPALETPFPALCLDYIYIWDVLLNTQVSLV